jgi:Helix-turn-helix domain
MSDSVKRCPNIAWAFWTACDLQLSPRERLVFFAIAERADANLHCAPTMEDLCDGTGLRRRTIWAAVHDLAQRGECIRVERLRDGLHYYLLRLKPSAERARRAWS